MYLKPVFCHSYQITPVVLSMHLHVESVIPFWFLSLCHTWCCSIAVWCCIICCWSCWAVRPWFCCCSNCCICWGRTPCCPAIIMSVCWLPELSSMALLDLTLRLAALWLGVGEFGAGENELIPRWWGLLSSASWERGEGPYRIWLSMCDQSNTNKKNKIAVFCFWFSWTGEMI